MSSTDEVAIRGEHKSEIKVVGRAGEVRPIAVPEGVTQTTFIRIVSAADVAFRVAGRKPTLAEIHRHIPKVERKTIAAVMVTEGFIESMRLRGVGLIAEDGLSPQQAAVLNMLEDFSSSKNLTEKLRLAGVSRPQFNGWLKDPAFRHLYEQRVESHLEASHLVALSTIMHNAESGDQKAAEKLLEITGRYNPQNAELANARVVVQSLVEAIQKHVPDPEIQRAIIDEVNAAQKLASLTTQTAISNR